MNSQFTQMHHSNLLDVFLIPRRPLDRMNSQLVEAYAGWRVIVSSALNTLGRVNEFEMHNANTDLVIVVHTKI